MLWLHDRILRTIWKIVIVRRRSPSLKQTPNWQGLMKLPKMSRSGICSTKIQRSRPPATYVHLPCLKGFVQTMTSPVISTWKAFGLIDGYSAILHYGDFYFKGSRGLFLWELPDPLHWHSHNERGNSDADLT